MIRKDLVIFTLAPLLFATNVHAEVDPEKLGEYFSFGLSVLHFKDPHIESAEVRNGVVRVTDKIDNRVTPWLQAQYIFDGTISNWNYVKPGIFLGVGFGPEGNSLDTFGVGGMLSMKRTKWSDKEDTRSLNIGLGLYTTKVKRLPKDAQEGMALPEGVESVPFIKENETGLMLNISFSI
ncbi:MAG: hypothetical protein JAY85_19930 [Candidatus Thiodiazotropha weberae]|uniref:hypothetical protein n=1 Tax=Candidatus Thiodiazotropha endoloripes TaxID=1818881 RepID=UPI00083D326E|nr:hypothetical protein [Candidatus Thiodiazotropha endoloripes]MCG7900716.1 hypothetical protein [Candidatus Thiodiazotropha weberae]ODB87700.1 hypothetical protein A3193_02000 [Candidatus Thiodiazotropha endoloripes]ODB89946.1 hypothetical protein A3195_00055 [Candidatus Thiodiazotropha endoloripes]